MKRARTVILSTTIIGFILLVMNKFHFLYNTACESGFTGLRLLLIYIGIAIIAFGVFSLIKVSKKNHICRSCKSNIQEEWEVCPYCGFPLKGGTQ